MEPAVTEDKYREFFQQRPNEYKVEKLKRVRADLSAMGIRAAKHLSQSEKFKANATQEALAAAMEDAAVEKSRETGKSIRVMNSSRRLFVQG